MKVIDSSPRFWYLLQDEAGILIDVNCEHSFVSYDFAMRLSDEEISTYESDGRTYLDRLAEALNYSCQIARGSASIYKDRNLIPTHGDAIYRACMRWKEAVGEA